MAGSVSQVTGIFASPANRVPYGPMMDAAFDELGYDIHFLTCEVSSLRLADAIAGARAMGWMGFLIGQPHQRAVVTNLDGLAESAAVIGSATCAARRGDAFVGENTQGWAVVEALEEYLDPDGCRAVVFGAGEVARSTIVELARAGASSITIVNRTSMRAMQVARLLTGIEDLDVTIADWSEEFVLPPTTDVVVNATPLGSDVLAEERLPIAVDSLRPSMVAVDFPLNPHQTQFVKEAHAARCPVIDGLDITVGQGALAIRLWTNADADLTVMRQELLAELHELTE